MPQKNLNLEHHQQDTDYYCGAACAQMVLSAPIVGAGLLDQDDLYADNHSHSTIEAGWATGPDGLTWTLNDRRPPAFAASRHFVLFALTSEDATSRKIAWTIEHYEVAPVALVYGSQHWIVVHGYDADDTPSSSADTSYALNGFFINNPWPPTPSADTPASAPPPPHSTGDGCGTGGNRGIANEHITYATWQADYMTGATGGHWNGKFIAVCDPEPPAERPGRDRKPERPADGRRLLSPDAVIRPAMDGLKFFDLERLEPWRAVLRDPTPAEPLLVQRLDRTDTFYYIVPIRSGGRNPSAAVSVDARFGLYRQAAAFGKDPAPFSISREEAFRRVLENRLDLGELRGRLKPRKEALCFFPALVWKPCRESLSPFYPFYLFTAGAQRIYVRVDGAVFTALHDTARGI